MTPAPEYDDTHEKTADTDTSRKPSEKVDPSLRIRVQRALGEEPGEVRIHTGPAAEAEAEERNARALVRKNDIYFARDEYRPGTEEGNRLLAHELAHTLQQAGSGAETGDRRALEEEADNATSAIMSGGRGRIGLKAPPGSVQLQEKGKEILPTVQKHPDEIPPVPDRGSISGGGLTMPYLYSSSAGATFVSLVLQVSEGIAVVATPLTDLHEGADYRVQNASGTKARSVVISVSSKLLTQPKMQLTFTRGSSGYVVVFQFPTTAGKK